MTPPPKRPDWIWGKRRDGSYEYWTREKVEIRAYIEYLEQSAPGNRDCPVCQTPIRCVECGWAPPAKEPILCPRCNEPVSQLTQHRTVVEYYNNESGEPKTLKWECNLPAEEPKEKTVGELMHMIEQGICPKCERKMWRPTPEMRWFKCFNCDKVYPLFDIPAKEPRPYGDGPSVIEVCKNPLGFGKRPKKEDK